MIALDISREGPLGKDFAAEYFFRNAREDIVLTPTIFVLHAELLVDMGYHALRVLTIVPVCLRRLW
jgi:hypothetical protein